MVELIPVIKNDEYIEINPVALHAHEVLGWVRCPRRHPVEAVTESPKTIAKPKPQAKPKK